ncbi:MAG: demethylmenaquinone methyltransferase/2-methoxy-6-polyprenyl-1,4-benzoquinol methylase [Parasphingorhabdus sp.]|jgi:demethylmenaquinone methyltransferase/2-methoxy-6-polyprenyl-1,4-benzoquinol methylase
MNQDKSAETTHFGFKDVKESDKAGLVGEVFSSVAGNYDVMNDAMSFGVHRLWKNFAVSQSGLKTGNSALDVAAGSGDLSREFSRQVGETGTVIMTDINYAMLHRGRDVMMDKGATGNVFYSITDAENLSFDSDTFNCVSISFGLRNVTRISNALKSMYRVLRPGGRLLILEFSRPVSALMRKAYDTYSFNVIPRMGQLIAGDRESYQYLVESIRKHPDQETLAELMRDAGFEDVRWHNLTGGVVALHTGFKY